jgi:hypothetical protein
MNASFLMDRNPVGTGFDEFGDEKIGMLDHQVAIERNFEVRAETLHHRRTYGEIGDKVAVHDVEMEDGTTARDGLFGVSGELSEVGGED